MMSDIVKTYVARIEHTFPDIPVNTVILNADGLTNDVLIVNDEWVVRFAKNDASRELLQYEARLLTIVCRHVSLPVPMIEQESAGMALYRFLPGVPLYRHRLAAAPAAQRQRLLMDLAQFLRELHTIPVADLPAPPWQLDDSGDARRKRYVAQLHAVEKELFPMLWADQRAWIEHHFAPVVDGMLDLDDYVPACIHADLATYHILYDERAGRLTGVIDFGTAGVGDPAVDFACLISAYGESILRSLPSTYPLDQVLVDRARFLAGALELEWALNAVRRQDFAWLLVHLGRARDAQPIGTPW